MAALLLPFGFLFGALVRLRRLAYRRGWLTAERLPVAVVVIGNIVAGGAGKTPLTLWLAQRLATAGRHPGIVSRGYGRTSQSILEVGVGDTATHVGEEALLLARRSHCPVFVGSDRAAASLALLAAHPQCDVILCDDGLQHYRLQRDLEIAVVDRRGCMNGWPLPAGPLREPVSRLQEVDAVVLNAAPPLDSVAPTFVMRLHGTRFYRLDDPAQFCTAQELAGMKLHAVAGIGEPARFFDHLAAQGLNCVAHAFPDHHAYTPADLDFSGDAILMTEKDALKCHGLARLPIWVLPVDAEVQPDLARFVLEKLDGCAPA